MKSKKDKMSNNPNIAGPTQSQFPSERIIDENTRPVVKPNQEYEFNLPEPSDWKCYMFGSRVDSYNGLVYRPTKGNEPNRFVRWMMQVCFACEWVKA